MKKYHYVYKITNLSPTDERKYYIGVRSSKVEPELDTNYNSSSTYLKKALKEIGHKHFSKEVLSEFSNRELATQEEIRLHNLYDVAKNVEFYNMSKQTSTGFDPTGFINVIDERDNTTHYVSLKEYYELDHYVSWKKGMITALDIETGEYRNVTNSEFKKNEKLVGPNKGKVTIFDTKNNTTKMVTINEFKENDNYISINQNKTNVIDTRDGLRKKVTIDDYNKYDYYVSISKDTISILDEYGNYKMIPKQNFDGKKHKKSNLVLVKDKNTKQYKKVTQTEYKKNKNYITPGTGMVTILENGEIKRVSKDVYKNGNFKHLHSGKVTVKDIRLNKTKMVTLEEYENNIEYYVQIRCQRYEIYDNDGKLRHSISTGLERYCRQHNLPFRVLENSYINGGTPIYKNPSKKIIENGNIKYKGWYAIKVN